MSYRNSTIEELKQALAYQENKLQSAPESDWAEIRKTIAKLKRELQSRGVVA